MIKIIVLISYSVKPHLAHWVVLRTKVKLTFEAQASQVALVVKNLPASAGDISDTGLIPGSGRSPGAGHGNPPQYFCLENPTDRGAWWASVHRVTKSRT